MTDTVDFWKRFYSEKLREPWLIDKAVVLEHSGGRLSFCVPCGIHRKSGTSDSAFSVYDPSLFIKKDELFPNLRRGRVWTQKGLSTPSNSSGFYEWGELINWEHEENESWAARTRRIGNQLGYRERAIDLFIAKHMDPNF